MEKHETTYTAEQVALRELAVLACDAFDNYCSDFDGRRYCKFESRCKKIAEIAGVSLNAIKEALAVISNDSSYDFRLGQLRALGFDLGAKPAGDFM